MSVGRRGRASHSVQMKITAQRGSPKVCILSIVMPKSCSETFRGTGCTLISEGRQTCGFDHMQLLHVTL